MSAQNLKEDLELIAALAAGTAGFINNNVNKMMVGDGKFVKTDIQPRSVIEKAKEGLVREYAPTLQKVPVKTLPAQVQDNQQDFQPQLDFQPAPVKVQQVIESTVYKDQQLTFNFDNSPTAQNIYYKLNTILEKVEALNVKVHTLSEQVNKKKVRTTKEKV